MNTADFKAKGFDELRAQYKAYLIALGLSRSTISTAYTDTFYLWRRVSKETFWRVLESDNFEADARATLLDALRANSSGNVESLVSGYAAHLRRFRRFLAQDTKTAPAAAGSVSVRRSTSYSVEVPRPSPQQAALYLSRWDELENYHLQERALNQLFHQLCPKNKTIEDILLKAATLNEFYSTNIYSIFPVAKQILDLDIDARLLRGDLTLVNDIQTVTINGKEYRFYSFASKYCSHHNERDFPIYDSYVDGILRYFRAQDGFAQFSNHELKEYSRFKEILIAFRSYYDLDQFSLKEVDKYIWQLGKDYFPKSFNSPR